MRQAVFSNWNRFGFCFGLEEGGREAGGGLMLFNYAEEIRHVEGTCFRILFSAWEFVSWRAKDDRRERSRFRV